MSSLATYEEDLLFDSCLGLTCVEEAAHVEALTARDEQAADLHTRILVVLVPLESVHCAPCPDALAERTVRLLCATAQTHKRWDASIPLVFVVAVGGLTRVCRTILE